MVKRKNEKWKRNIIKERNSRNKEKWQKGKDRFVCEKWKIEREEELRKYKKWRNMKKDKDGDKKKS